MWSLQSFIPITGGLNHLPYLLSISVSKAVIKDFSFSTNYMKALGLNQAYMLLKLGNNYHIVLTCSFGSITGNTNYSYKQKVYRFFLYLDNTDDFLLILKMILILNTIMKVITFYGFSLVYLIDFQDFISSK